MQLFEGTKRRRHHGGWSQKREGSHERPRYKTVAQIADTFFCSTDTVRRWIASGQLRAYKFEGSIRIDDDDVRRFVVEREIPAPTPSRSRLSTKPDVSGMLDT